MEYHARYALLSHTLRPTLRSWPWGRLALLVLGFLTLLGAWGAAARPDQTSRLAAAPINQPAPAPGVLRADAPAVAPQGLTPTPTCTPLWAVVTSPNPSASGTELYGVAALAADNVWAVGGYYDEQRVVRQTLVEHWDGAQWSVVPSPNAGASDNHLLGASALSPNDIWAVGFDLSAAGPEEALAEHWDGSAWQIVPVPPPTSTTPTRLQAVAGRAPDDVWAVGYSLADVGGVGYERTFVVHWDGLAWSVVPSPNPTTDNNSLASLTVLAADDVWAVGEYYLYNQQEVQPLTLHWDGTQWTQVPCPHFGDSGTNNDLYQVVAASPTDVWAVGTYTQGGNPAGLILHWDGLQWSQVPGPDVPGGQLLGATLRAADDIWAVGYVGIGGTSLIEHWDGTAWSRVGSPNQAQVNVLAAVAALGPADVWAIGFWYNVFNPDFTLTEHYGDPCLPPTPTATSTPLPPTASATSTLTSTPLPPTATAPPPLTSTPLAWTPTPAPPAATATPCSIQFRDVQPADYFYAPVLYLACRGVVSGYADGTFRPYAATTRAQMVKIVVLGFGLPLTTPTGGAYTFHDVDPAQPFFAVIETAAAHGIVAGYGCGGPGEPCDARQRPYFRPNAAVTRGQLAKIDVVAAQWPLVNPAHPTFTDVPPGSAFYEYIETAACHGIISGYADHSFHPGATATRGQISKIVYLSLTATGACASAPAAAP